MDSPTTLKHRRRYKFNKKLGKYVRIKKPRLEQIHKQNISLTTPTIDSTFNIYVTNHATTVTNNISSSIISDISNTSFTEETIEKSFMWNIFAPCSSDTFIAKSATSTTTTITPTTALTTTTPTTKATIAKSTATATTTTTVTTIPTITIATTATTTTATTIPTITIATTTTTTTTTAPPPLTMATTTTSTTSTKTATTTTTAIPLIVTGSSISLKRTSLLDRLLQQKRQHQSFVVLPTTRPLTLPLLSSPSQPLLQIPLSPLSILGSLVPSTFPSSLLSSTPIPLPSVPVRLQLPNMGKNADLSKKKV
ncbi:hypothetical protein LOAG_16433 [Loa loa]|uniref:Uncharacterized protein n=1 Tax=Loa loa TaxID=7209 RepID=A0A1S0ULR9_LOALO|nr:hypothetical protein LOAG_16433 [Loa loa]EJD76672.1 hypothetical protein LOAG_16433 [Loa loa]